MEITEYNENSGSLGVNYSDWLDMLNALKTLGMRCLVMSQNGTAFACEFMLEVNEDGSAWRQVGWNPFSKCLSPDVLNNYTKDWKGSLIDLNSIPSNMGDI